MNSTKKLPSLFLFFSLLLLGASIHAEEVSKGNSQNIQEATSSEADSSWHNERIVLQVIKPPQPLLLRPELVAETNELFGSDIALDALTVVSPFYDPYLRS